MQRRHERRFAIVLRASVAAKLIAKQYRALGDCVSVEIETDVFSGECPRCIAREGEMDTAPDEAVLYTAGLMPKKLSRRQGSGWKSESRRRESKVGDE